MADAERPTTSALATRSGRDGALDAALERLAPGRPPDRPDTPDLHVTAVRRLPAVAASYAEFPPGLDPRLRQALASRGVTAPYTHQAAAIEHALARRNVVVITPTASGKTLCYNGPVLHSILEDPSSRALYLFPTKALAQDQLAELQTLCEIIDQQSGDADRRLHLRWRYAPGCEADDPRPRARRAQQSRHGACGHPAAPSPLGQALRESPLRHRRRAARLSRRVRQPPVQRAPAAAPHLPPLRIGSGLPVFVGDYCEPA